MKYLKACIFSKNGYYVYFIQNFFFAILEVLAFCKSYISMLKNLETAITVALLSHSFSFFMGH